MAMWPTDLFSSRVVGMLPIFYFGVIGDANCCHTAILRLLEPSFDSKRQPPSV